ncbi:hypothetical protein ACFL0Y_03670 [Patescibacteria group bacterium]
MGRLRLKKRRHQIKVKQKRKAKLAKFRLAYTKAKTEEGKKKALAKLQKIAPWLSEKELLAPIAKKE